MKKFEGYLMVSDLDGTFFAKGTTIPQRNLDAVNYFMDNGGKFTISTGRSIVASKIIAKNIPKNVPSILFNGALLYDFTTDMILESTGIQSINAIDLLIKVNKKYPKIQAFVFKDFQLYCTTHNYQTLIADSLCMHSIYEPDPSKIPFPWYKILFGGQPRDLMEISSYISTLSYPDLTHVKSSSVLLEVLVKGIDKGYGLRKLAHYLNVPINKTIAVGDYYNDEQLLKTAGIAFLPSNAVEELKYLGTIVGNHEKGAIADVVDLLDLQTNLKK